MRKKVFASIVFLVTMLFAVVGWAAVYYLSPSGSATPPYDTWEKAANNLSQILSLDLTGENTIYVAEGTYSGSSNYILLDEAKFANLSIIGKGKANQVIFSPGTNTSCYIDNTSISNVTFENITIENSASYAIWVNNGDNIRFIGCNIIGKEGISSYLTRTENQSDVSFNYSVLWLECYPTSYSHIFRVNGDASLSVNYCVIYSPNGSPHRIIDHRSTGSVTVNNSVLAKSKTEVVYHYGTGDLSINNCIIIGSTWARNDYPAIRRSTSAGSCIVNNSVILPATYYPEDFISDGVNTQNVLYQDPKFKHWPIRGFIIPRVDDPPNVDYALSLADLLEEYGYKGSYFLETAGAASRVDKLRTLVQGGIMEVGGHSYSHQDLAYDHALHFEYTGSDANPTVELDSSRVIHLRTDGSDDVDIDTTQPDADTLGEIINNYNGTNNWTISYSTTDGQKTDHFRSACKAESLAEMPATAAPCDIDFLKETDCTDGNCSGLYKVEVYEPKIELTSLINAEGDIIDPQTGQKYETKTFVCPFNSGDENVVEAIRTSGYMGTTEIHYFASKALPLNVFKLPGTEASSLIVEGDEEQTTKNAEMFAINVAINGLTVSVLAHNESEVTLEEWRWILNGFKRAQEAGYNIQVTSLQLAVEALKRLGTYDPSTGDVNIQWAMPSFRLRYDSPCIDAGIKLPIHDENWRDLAGNTVRYGTAPDIGCYEYKTWPIGAWGMLPWIGGRHKVQWTPYE